MTISKISTLLGVLAGTMAIAVAPIPAQAQDQFDNNTIQFDVDTVVEFEFVSSNGLYQSTFGVINLDTGDRTVLIREVKPADQISSTVGLDDLTIRASFEDAPGTPGNAVPQPLAEFEFKANARYALYLESTYAGRSAGVFYSANGRNPSGEQRLQLNGNVAGLGNGGVLLRWDDTGSLLVREALQDSDFDDFVVRAGGHLACPYEE